MIVATGPTGNVGAEVAAGLVDAWRSGDPTPFRLAAHSPDGLRRTHGEDVPVVALDYDDPTSVRVALEGVEVLFLVFPLPTPLAVRRRMRPFVDAAAEAGCRHVVYLSVPGADTSRVVPHHWVERHLAASPMTTTVLRPSYFCQNLHRRVSTHGVDVVEHGEVLVPAGAGRTSFVDSRDVAEVALAALRDPEAHAGTAPVLTGPEALGFDAVAEALSDVLDRPVRYVDASVPAFVRRLRARGVGWDVIGFMLGVYTLSRTGRNAQLSDDLPRLLGRPSRTVRDWARDSAWRFEQRAWS